MISQKYKRHNRNASMYNASRRNLKHPPLGIDSRKTLAITNSKQTLNKSLENMSLSISNLLRVPVQLQQLSDRTIKPDELNSVLNKNESVSDEKKHSKMNISRNLNYEDNFNNYLSSNSANLNENKLIKLYNQRRQESIQTNVNESFPKIETDRSIETIYREPYNSMNK